MLNNSLICSGARNPFRFYAVRSRRIKADVLNDNSETPSSLEIKDPVLFLQKYNTLIDTKPIPQNDKKIWDEERVRYVVESVKSAPTYEIWKRNISLKTSPFQYRGDNEPIAHPSSANSLTLNIDEVAGKRMHWKDADLSLKNLPREYASLAKSRLTFLVVLTSAAGYGLAPGGFDPITFSSVVLGTALTASSANAINQIMEVPFDSQMNRTKDRVLVRGRLNPRHALGFALASGVGGSLILYHGASASAAGLGISTLLLYTLVYTPMKRFSIWNTWVGSLVGAIPPLIGWAGCSGTLDSGACILAGILFAWQFPHFNALSWNLRADYSRAGYQMMSVIDPVLCRKVAVRYSLGTIGVCSLGAPILGVTDWTFALDSLPINLYLTYLSYDFYKKADSPSSRKLFRFTLVHLPLLMTLLFIGKKSIGD